MQVDDTLTKSRPAGTHEGYRISLKTDKRRIRATYQGEIIADSSNVLVMHETRLAPVFYFPPKDVRMDLLIESSARTHCPFKGNASYWTIRVGDKSVKDAAWSYQEAYDESSGVEGYIAFDWQAIDRWTADDTNIANQPQNKDEAKENPLINWILRDAGLSTSSRDLVMRLSDALIAAGIPLWRLRLLIRTLNPLLFAMVYTWQRGDQEVTQFELSHDNLQSEQYRDSPFAKVINGEGGIRRRLEGPNARIDFSVLEDLVAEGATDYVAMPLQFSDGQLNILTLVSDRPGGFSSEEFGQIYEILAIMSRLFETHAVRLSSATLLRTYLGSDAGQRVMDGLVKRGDGEDIHAAIWITDLRGSTPLAASMSRDDYLSLLNRYFDCMAGAVLANGGEVLKFIGDSVLAIFAIDDADQKEPEACARALAAAVEASDRIAAVNKEYANNGHPLLDFGIGLHRGDLTYGNVGAAKRLDFTVIGSAVNEAARIESLSKKIHRQIVISSAFRDSVPGELVSLGQHTLPGVTGEREIFGVPAA